jgi:hypothetical protein
MVSKLSGGSSTIWILIFFTHPGSRIQGSKRHRIRDLGSATLVLYVTNLARLAFVYWSTAVPIPRWIRSIRPGCHFYIDFL